MLIVAIAAAVAASAAFADGGAGTTARALLYSSNWSPDFRQSEIFGIPAGGGERTAVVPSPACETSPVVSPDGTKLAFVRGADSGCGEYSGRLHVAPLAGGPAVDVAPAVQGVTSFSWSPDSTQLGFSSHGSVYVAAAGGGSLLRLGEGGDRPTWSPDGAWIAFWLWESDSGDEGGTNWIVVARPDGSAERRLVEGVLPAWSPDGTRIAFTGCGDGGDLCTIAPSGGAVTRIADGGASSLVWSPDGSRIAFHREYGSEGAYVVAADGSRIDRIAADAASAPAWSPDGSRLALVVDDDRGDYLLVVRPDGSGGVRVAEGSGAYSAPSWSRDGTRLYYASLTGDNDFDVWVRGAGNGPPRALTHDPLEEVEPAWSPDGSGIAFVRGTRDVDGFFDFKHGYDMRGSIYVMREDGTGVRRITSGHDDASPDWSPDGRRLVFERDGALWIANASGPPRPRRLTSADERSHAPAWSPDGRLIAFERWYDEDDAFSIAIVRAAGGAARRLTDGDADDRAPAWSPDGASVLFSRDLGWGGWNTQLHVVGRNGGRAVPVTSPRPTACTGGITRALMPAWSTAGEIAFVREGGACASPDVFTVGRDGRGERVLADTRADELWPDWRPR